MTTSMMAVRIQQFEYGFIVYTRVPRAHAPNQWYVLVETPARPEYHTFVAPIAFLGPDARAYRASEHAAPPGYHLPAGEFGGIWLAARAGLGWGEVDEKTQEWLRFGVREV